jgi:hypothetical protein
MTRRCACDRIAVVGAECGDCYRLRILKSLPGTKKHTGPPAPLTAWPPTRITAEEIEDRDDEQM